MSGQEWNASQAQSLLPTLYAELRKIAAAQMSKLPAGSTLQPTALVHEAWIRLGSNPDAGWDSQAHFLRSTAETMRNILIDRARQRRAARHGGGQARVDIEQIELPIKAEDEDRLLAVSDAIAKLAVEHPNVAELAKLRCFGGLEITEAAKVLDITRTTAYRRWEFARAWLFKELRSGQ